MPEIEQEKLDAMMAEVKPEKRDAFLQDFKSRGYTIKPVSTEEGITPENPLETGANLVQLAGAYIKSNGMQGDKARLGAAPSDSVGGVRGAIGEGVQKVGEVAGDMIPKTPGQVGGMIAADTGVGLAAKGFNKFIAASPELRAATDAAVAKAKSAGFKLLPSQETQSYLAGLFENVMRKLPGGAAVFQRYEQMQNAGYVAAKNKIIEGLGKETEMEFGGSLKESLQRSNDVVTARADALLQKGLVSREAYDAALERHERRLAQTASDSLRGSRQEVAYKIGGFPTQEGRGLAVQVERAHQAALDNLQREVLWTKAMNGVPAEVNKSVAANLVKESASVAKDLKGAGIKDQAFNAAMSNLPETESKEVTELLQKARSSGLVGEAGAGEGPRTYTFNDLQRKQSLYGDLSSSQRNPDGTYNAMGNMFRRLQKATQADMDAIFAHPGVPTAAKTNYQIAKAFSKEQMGLNDLKVIKGLWNENPSAILDSVVKAGDRRGTQTLIQALGSGEAGKTQLRRHVFDEIFGAGDAALPSHDKVMARLSAYSDNLTALFSPAEQKQLYALGEKSQTPAFIQDQYDKRVKAILDSYKRRADMARDPILRSLAEKEPHQLMQSVLAGDTNVVRAIKKYVPAEQFTAYQRYGMRDLLADPVLPQRGMTAIKDELAKKPEFYKELLGEKNWAEMQRIGDAELLLPGYKDLKAPSKMQAAGAQLGMAATFGVMGLILHPFGSRTAGAVAGVGLGLTIAPQMLSEMYLSDSGRRVITTLLRLPQIDPRTDFLLGKLMAAGYVTASNAMQPQKQPNGR